MRDTARTWLSENGYLDVAKLIDEIIAEWKNQGKKTRRNWWEYLSGDKDGNPRIISGRKIPVLRAAQIRQGVKVTENAMCLNENEIPLKIRENTKWKKISIK